MPPSPRGSPPDVCSPTARLTRTTTATSCASPSTSTGVLAGDSAERNFRRMQQEDPDNALEQYAEYEREHADQPIEGRAAQTTARRHQHPAGSPPPRSTMEGKPSLRVYLVTARNAPAHKRAVQTLEQWGLTVDEAFFLGGLDKTEVLNKFSPHIFFDDQLSNLSARSLHIPRRAHPPSALPTAGTTADSS